MSQTPLDAAPATTPAPLAESAILALCAGQETDAALAVHVLGWRWLLDPTSTLSGLRPPEVPDWISWNVPAGAIPVITPAAYARFRDWHRLGSPADAPYTPGLPCWRATIDGMDEVIAALRARHLY